MIVMLVIYVVACSLFGAALVMHIAVKATRDTFRMDRAVRDAIEDAENYANYGEMHER